MNEIKGNELRELTPSQDFKGNVAYATFPIRAVEENKVTEQLMVVTSERKCYPLTPENLFLLGFYAKRTPFPVNRWSEKGMRAFLEGNGKVGLHSVFTQVNNQFKAFIDFPDPGYYSLLTLWVLGSYWHRIFSSYPYLHLTGEISTGKTKTLTLISLMSFNAELIFNSTAPYLIRVIHNNHATLCIDEAENLRSKDSVLVSMLNIGYKRNTWVGKMEKENGSFIPCLFEGYSPKAFASVSGLSRSLASRCIRVRMTESLKGEIKNREIDIENQVFEEIRSNLYASMLTEFRKVREIYSGLTDNEIKGRDWEIWKPILALSKLLENKVNGIYGTVRKLAINQIKERKEERMEETTPKFLVHLKETVNAYPLKTDFYPAAYLLQSLRKNPGFETAEAKLIASQLKNLGLISSGSILKKLNGKVTRGYCLDRKAITERLKAVTG